jgi:hypothetical protein
MKARTQITMEPELRRRAQAKAAELGISFADVRRLVADDLAQRRPKTDMSRFSISSMKRLLPTSHATRTRSSAKPSGRTTYARPAARRLVRLSARRAHERLSLEPRKGSQPPIHASRRAFRGEVRRKSLAEGPPSLSPQLPRFRDRREVRLPGFQAANRYEL